MRLFPNKNKFELKVELNIIKSHLPTNLQLPKQKLLSGNGFVECK